MRLLITSFVTVAMALTTTAAQAETVDLTFGGLTGGGVAVKAKHRKNGAGGSAGSMVTTYTAAGRFEWNGGDINSFCIELTQWAGDGTFEVIDLDDPSAPPVGSWPTLTSSKIDGIAELYENHGVQALTFSSPSSDADLTEAAAFQIALWEIVHESDETESPWSVTSGDAKFVKWEHSGLNGDLSQDSIDLAQAWLSELNGLQDDAWRTALQILASSHKQDQIIMVALPGPMIIGAIGILGVAVGRRRLTTMIR